MYALSPENTVTYKTDKNILLNSASNTLLNNVHYTIYLAVKVKVIINCFDKQITIWFFEEMTNNEQVKFIDVERRGCRYPDENFLKVSKYYSYSFCTLEHLYDVEMKLCGCVLHLMPGASM